MTAEIAIMNRNAVVLAADSATTVTSWKNGIQEIRYFKGANKLFELSYSCPVGLMIFGSAGLQGVPWELAVKAFRHQSGQETHEHLPGYADQFFRFVECNTQLFSDESKAAQLMRTIGPGAWRLQSMIAGALQLPADDELLELSLEDFERGLTTAEHQIQNLALPELMRETDLAHALTSLAGTFEAEAQDVLPLFGRHPERAHLIPRYVHAFIALAVKEFPLFAEQTGVVIAGYGTQDMYPRLEVYMCYGMMGNRLVYERENNQSRAMSADSPAVIEPFATTGTINTFRFGVAPDAFEAVMNSTHAALVEFGKQVMIESGAQTPLDEIHLSNLARQATQQHTDRWFKETSQRHFDPLSGVIHSLPLPDMAALAKSLIDLESLKERVTKPSESVSGPIDVAVISKYDGFVWIDRKHYFDPALNPRYFKKLDI
ncbi:MAG: hypothetical protein QNL70_12905 [Pseudomonas sp.]